MRGRAPSRTIGAMKNLKIVLGGKNTSSWSLRPWLALKATGAPFEEEVILFGRADTKARIAARSPSGKVPVLYADGAAIWESLAICEYLAETFPEAGLWPRDPAARAAARAVSCEMHAGFQSLRGFMPMDFARERPKAPTPEVQADIERIAAIWRDCRARFGGAGQLLFGGFTIADAMYAPVVSRFRTYGVALDPVCEAYKRAVWALPAMQEWLAAARREIEE